jgi:hypothetical protein
MLSATIFPVVLLRSVWFGEFLLISAAGRETFGFFGVAYKLGVTVVYEDAWLKMT